MPRGNEECEIMSNLHAPVVSSHDAYFVGVDVGTGSARAGVFDSTGTMLASMEHRITVFREGQSIVEQSSAEIWEAVCSSVQSVVSVAGISTSDIAGIGFDATCSLVVVGASGKPLKVGNSGSSQRDVMVWMDHRAIMQAEQINRTEHPVLQYVGGTISPEMQTPKLLWLSEHKRETFDAAWQFFDLVDFLTWRATGDLARSACTVTCKWTYLAHESRWDPSYFYEIGLGILADEEFSRIGNHVVDPGSPLGAGLDERAAADLDLPIGTPVAAGMIDAHAGGIGTVGIDGDPSDNLAYVFGTSSCTMTSTQSPKFVPGVWGPYFSAMIPGMWLNEGGQSAAGSAIDQLILHHPMASEATKMAKHRDLSLPVFLAELAQAEVSNLHDVVSLAAGLHVVPEFLGNRAPFADPHARAAIVGLGMERGLNSLISLYVAGLCGVGYGLRQIIDAQNEVGARISKIVISGGAGESDLIRQLLADATGVPVMSGKAREPVLLGAAILGSVAALKFENIVSAMKAMSSPDRIYEPKEGDIAAVHERRYRKFGVLQAAERELRWP